MGQERCHAITDLHPGPDDIVLPVTWQRWEAAGEPAPVTLGDLNVGERDSREAYRKRRCIVPIDGFFEWMAIKGAKVKQPYAIAMKDRSPFGIAGVWENWRNPASGEWVRTFAIITVPANSLVSRIHDRMPAILGPDEFDRWLGEEVNPRDLMRPFDSDLITMWPVSTRVNSPKNDDPSLLEAVDLIGCTTP